MAVANINGTNNFIIAHNKKDQKDVSKTICYNSNKKNNFAKNNSKPQ